MDWIFRLGILILILPNEAQKQINKIGVNVKIQDDFSRERRIMMIIHFM